jgi:protein-tyrosine-phosphatase
MTLHVAFLCTGNAARSVMAGALLSWRDADVTVTTAGTHVLEGQPMSWRTRSALETVGITGFHHRSRQLRAGDADAADLVVGLAGEHVGWVRRELPAAAAKTATLRRLVRDLPLTTGPLQVRLAALRLADVDLEPWEDVEDPAGQEVDTYHAVAADIASLVERLHALLRHEGPGHSDLG